jgi:hypothetical protein
MRFVHQPYSGISLGEILNDALTSGHWDAFDAAIAFVKRSGTTHVKANLYAFSRTRPVRIAVGTDHAIVKKLIDGQGAPCRSRNALQGGDESHDWSSCRADRTSRAMRSPRGPPSATCVSREQ